MFDRLDDFDRQTDSNVCEDERCESCGGELVTIQDEYSDAVVCPDCECDDLDDYDGQPDEFQEWYDFDPDC